MIIGTIVLAIGLFIIYNYQRITEKIIEHIAWLAENSNDDIKVKMKIENTTKVIYSTIIISLIIIVVGICLINNVAYNQIISGILWILGINLLIFSKKLALWVVAISIVFYGVPRSVIVMQISLILGSFILMFLALIYFYL